MSLVYVAQPAADSNGNYYLPQGTTYYNASVTVSSIEPCYCTEHHKQNIP